MPIKIYKTTLACSAATLAMAPLVVLLPTYDDAQAASAPGESPPFTNYVRRESSLKTNYSASSIPLQINLDLVTATEKAALGIPRKGQPLKIGFGRYLPLQYQGDLQPLLTWKTLSNGDKVAAFLIHSPEASGIRLGLNLEAFPATAELRFFNLTQPQQVFGPFRAATLNSQKLFWSPTVTGENIGVEIYVPASVSTKFSIKVANLQHLVYAPLAPNAQNFTDIDRAAGACEIDVKCQTTTPANLSAAVAKIIFTRPEGSFMCTGTLLSDKDDSSFIPYFMTAHHCVSSQDVAATVESYWFYERATCNGDNPTEVTQFSNGADLLATNSVTDFALLKLRDGAISTLPGIHFAGWSTANPIGRSVIAIHHPAGDVKKWSEGLADKYTTWPPSQITDHIQVTWSQGVTEGGSSGSGIFAVTGEQNNQQLFVGALHGGYSYCNLPNEPDLYGRFDLVYPEVRQWLDATATTKAYLESPQAGSFESGIGVIRGWVCDANKIEMQIDAGTKYTVAYGTTRGDTQATCGDNNNGFGITYNWNLLEDGVHALKVFADGVEFANVSFTVTTLGTDFLQGVSGEFALSDFPQSGKITNIRWSEPHQNFVIIP